MMGFRGKSALLLLALEAVRAAAFPAVLMATELEVKGTEFLLNGKSAFLCGISYYAALGAPEEIVRRDLADMERLGCRWLRVWATWAAFGADVSAVDAEGAVREPFLGNLRRLVEECDRRGLVVDVTLSRGNGTVGPARLQSLKAHRRAVETVIAALKPYRNWYLDLANERNVKDSRFVSLEELGELRALVRELDPRRLVTASHGGDISRDELRAYLDTAQVDFITPHRPRHAGSPAETEARTKEILGWMKELGRVAPVHYQEPFRRGYARWQPAAADFTADARGARAGGAAGWCFHNGDQKEAPQNHPRRSFDLREKRLFEDLDEEEHKALEELRGLFSLAAPGVTPQAPAAPSGAGGEGAESTADTIIVHGKVVTVDPRFRIAESVAIKAGRIAAVGSEAEVERAWRGPGTRVIDAREGTVLPGLYDSHVHITGAATSELGGPLPALASLAEVFDHIRRTAASTPPGEWIVIRYAFPTRLKEARFPTRAELDEAAPRHPLLYHAGPAGVVNSRGLEVSGLTRETAKAHTGVVTDPATGEPTGLLRGAYGALKGLPAEDAPVSPEALRAAVKKLLSLYNAHGLTSVGDRNASRSDLDLFLALRDAGELTARINVARSFNPGGTREEIVARLESLREPGGRGGPTGAGDDWVRIGPIKLFLDGGMLNGTAYMRQPWPRGPAYQVTEEGYRGRLFIEPAQLEMVAEEAARRGWRVTAHTAGEGAMDVLLDAYDAVARKIPIRDLRFSITHANFPSERNLEICKRLGVCADVQPAWLWKDGAALAGILGAERMRWFQPYKTWLRYTTIGGGSDHMIGLDPLKATNPWSPWLAMWTALARPTERGGPLRPDESLSREEAIRLYTINNAYLHGEEKLKGSLEAGKLADVIIIDRDILTCPVDEIRDVKVRLTIVGGKIVHTRDQE